MLQTLPIPSTHSSDLIDVIAKVEAGERLNYDDGLRLFRSNDLLTVGHLADLVNTRLNGGQNIYFNQNRHINPTNVCAFHCNFCSFARTSDDEAGAYTWTPEQIVERIRPDVNERVTEFHIVSGLHPDRPFEYYEDVLRALKEAYPWVHLKAWTGVEIDFFAQLTGMDHETILQRLIDAGLGSMPGGGAEIFGLDGDRAEPVRATSLFVGIWFAVFSIPLFLLTPDRAATGMTISEATMAGFRQLGGTLGLLRRNPPIARFLLAHMLYTDGLFTLFAFGGIYAAIEFGMQPADILVFGIVLNIAAGCGAAGFAWLDDAIGSKKTILLALAGLILSGTGLVLVQADWHFWALAIMLGICVGPAQAAGRSLMARLSPERMETEMFGLYALAGKATAFSGPFVLGQVVQYSGSQRAGMASVVIFLVLGGMVLLSVREPQSRPS